MTKRAAIYTRVSTVDQNLQTQLLDLHQLASQRGYEIIRQYSDRISGAKVRRPGLGDLTRDARRGSFDVVLVWACDRIARSTRHFLEVLDELNALTSSSSRSGKVSIRPARWAARSSSSSEPSPN